MLTMKHIMRPRAGQEQVFCRPIGCFTVERQDGYMQFLAFDKRDTDTPDVWSGWDSEKGLEQPVMGNIYVMNEAGATIANFSYYLDAESLSGASSGPEPITALEETEDA